MAGTWLGSKDKNIRSSLPEGESTDLCIPDSGYPEEYGAVAKTLPKQAKVLYGCLSCEWRDSGVCPFNYEPGAATKSNTHRELICRQRVNWLLSLSPEHTTNWSKWQANFNRTMGQVILNRDYYLIVEVEQDLRRARSERERIEEEAENIPDPKERVAFLKKYEKSLLDLEMRKSELRSQFFVLWKEIARVDSANLDRETPKKHFHGVNVGGNISLTDIHRVMRGDAIVDAEFEEKEGSED